MPRKSSIRTLPREILERLNFLLTEDVLTLERITAWLDQVGHPRSQSAVHRYKQVIEKVAGRLRQSREITDAVTRELGEAAVQGKQGRLLVEMTRAIVFDLLTRLQDAAEAGENVVLAPKDVHHLGKGLAELGRALRFDQDFERKVREEVAKEAADTVETAAKEAGLSAATVAAIKEKILGVKVGP